MTSAALCSPLKPSEALRGLTSVKKKKTIFSKMFLDVQGIFEHVGVFFTCFLPFNSQKTAPGSLWGPLSTNMRNRFFFDFFPICSRIILEYIWDVFKPIRVFLGARTPCE